MRRPYLLTLFSMLIPALCLWGAIQFGLLPRGLVHIDRAEVASDIDRGIDALHGGDSHRANDDFQQAVAAQGGSSNAYVTVATRLMQSPGAPAAAPAVVNLLLPATKDRTLSWDPLLWATLADAYRRADDKAKATESDARADQTAQTLFATGGVGDAKPADLSADDKALRLSEISDYYNERKKDPVRGIQALRAAIGLPLSVPALALMRNNLGYLLADKGTTATDYAEAVRLTRQAVDANAAASVGPEDSATFLDSYGWALHKTGDGEGARRVLIEATSGDPTEPEAHYHLGVVYAALNEPTDAAVEFDRALQLQPSFPEAAAARAALPPLPASPPSGPSHTGFSLTPPPTDSPSPAATPSPTAAAPTPSPAPPAITPSSALTPAPTPSPAPKR